MIKCGKLENTQQCILYTRDGSKVLGRFPYSKHGGAKGAKAAAHKREGQIQFFKKKSVEAAVEQFGAPVVLAYLAKRYDCEPLRNVLVTYLEKARSEPPAAVPVEKAYKPPPGWNDPRSWLSAKKGASAIRAAAWRSMGGKMTTCMEHMKGRVDDAARFCAALKDAVKGTTKWRGKAKKSFEEEVEEALLMLQKDEQTDTKTSLDDMLKDVDLGELETWLAEWGGAESGQEPAAEPEPESEAEPAAEEPGIEPEPEEWDNDFLNFVRVQHQRRQAAIHEVVFGSGEPEPEEGEE